MTSAARNGVNLGTEPRRKPYHHGDLRRAIISSAIRRARHQGEKGIILREIATEIGVSATAAYRHFTNRAELVEIVARRGFLEMAESMLTAPVLDSGVAADPGSERAALAAWADVRNSCRAYIKFAADESEWTRMALEEAGENKSVLDDYFAVGNSLDKVIERGQSAGIFRENLSIHNELEFWSALQGLVSACALGLGNPNTDGGRMWEALDNLINLVGVPAILNDKGKELLARQKPFPMGMLSDLTDWI